jgi:uncharacterized protein (TIGR03083 family)
MVSHMDLDTALDVLRRESGLLAVAAGPALQRSVPYYPHWVVADLVVHTGRIHRWVTEIVRTLASERLAQPDVTPSRTPRGLTDWFMSGAADLALALQTSDPSARVWAFAGAGTVGFWRTRMAFETTIHRWDAQSATRIPDPIPVDVARDGVAEALAVYLQPRLQGAAIGGSGERVGLRCADGNGAWAIRLLPDAVEIVDEPDEADEADQAGTTLRGNAEDLWLFLMGRKTLRDLEVTGSAAVAERCAAAVALLPTPQR